MKVHKAQSNPQRPTKLLTADAKQEKMILPFWTPTLAEIDERAAAIRRGWSRERLQKRAGIVEMELAVVSMQGLWPHRAVPLD